MWSVEWLNAASFKNGRHGQGATRLDCPPFLVVPETKEEQLIQRLPTSLLSRVFDLCACVRAYAESAPATTQHWTKARNHVQARATLL